jgi:hypothetical protein
MGSIFENLSRLSVEVRPVQLELSSKSIADPVLDAERKNDYLSMNGPEQDDTPFYMNINEATTAAQSVNKRTSEYLNNDADGNKRSSEYLNISKV